MRLVPAEGSLGATLEGFDLSRPLDAAGRKFVLSALAERGVVRFPAQSLSSQALYEFSLTFGTPEVNVGGMFQEPGLPQVMTLSNIVEGGKPIGIGDAGQDWHTDMSYSSTVAFVNVLYAIKVPRRDGVTLGATMFCDMAAAYDALPTATKEAIRNRTALHDFAKFWDMMRLTRGSPRPPLSEAQRQAKPPVHHPLVFTHPLSGRTVLYANPGYAVSIDGMESAESDALLDDLFRHQVEPRFAYTFKWTEGDVLVWDNLRVIHKAVADYRADEPRLIKRCQVMADQLLPAGRPTLAAAPA